MKFVAETKILPNPMKQPSYYLGLEPIRKMLPTDSLS